VNVLAILALFFTSSRVSYSVRPLDNKHEINQSIKQQDSRPYLQVTGQKHGIYFIFIYTSISVPRWTSYDTWEMWNLL